MMSYSQYEEQIQTQNVAQMGESDLTPMILRSLVAGRSFARMPFLCPRDPSVHLRAKEHMFLHKMLGTRGVTQMGRAFAAMSLPCDWAQFLYLCTERGMEESALIIIAP